MLKKFKPIRLFAIVTTVAILGCSCARQNDAPSNGVSSTSSGISDASTITNETIDVVRIYTVGNEPGGWEQAEADINKRTREELGLEIDVTFAGWDNYGSKLQMELATGEAYSWVYDSTWCALSANLAAGYYMPLDNLLPQYAPDVVEMKTQTVLDANRNAGPDGEYHLYTLPNGSALAPIYQVWIRKDLREAMGIDEITSWDELLEYMYAVKENYPDMIPVSPYSNSGTQNQTMIAMQSQLDKTPGYMNVTGLSNEGIIYMKDNDGKYYNIFDDMPEAMWESIQQARQMYLDGIIDPDVMTGTADKFFEGTQAVLYKMDLGVNGDLVEKLKLVVPEAEVEAVSFYDYDRSGQVMSDFKAGDFMCMPVTCPDPEPALKFFNWLCQSQENYDMLESGVKGMTWEPVGDNQYQYNSDLWERFSWSIFRVPEYERLDANFTKEEVDHIMNNWRNVEWFSKSITTGFGFDSSNVQTEISNYNSATSQYWYAIANGVMDPEEGMAQYKEAAYDSVLKIQTEMQKQLDEYLAQQ